MPSAPLNTAPTRPAPATKDVGCDQTALLIGCATSAAVTAAAFGKPVATAKLFGVVALLKGETRAGTPPPILVFALATVVLPTVPVACASTAKTGPLPGVEAFAAARPEEPVATAIAFAAPPPIGGVPPVPVAPPVAFAVAKTALLEARLTIAVAPPPAAPLALPAPLPP